MLNRMTSPNLNCLIGCALESVLYFPLEYERDLDHLMQVPVYIGGEIAVKFRSHDPIWVGWGEDVGWPHHFSLEIVSITPFNIESSISVDASAFYLWRAHIGTALRGWRIWSFNDNPTPHVVELIFDAGSVFLGDGVGYDFGDGDDLIAADRLDTPAMNTWSLLAGSMRAELR